MNLIWIDNLCVLGSTTEVLGWIRSGILQDKRVFDAFLIGDQWQGTFVEREQAKAHVERAIRNREDGYE